LDLGVIPVVNENDTVVTDEIQFGDNDTLAALVANLIQASTLVLLTDQQGLMSANPSVDENAKLVTKTSADDMSLDAMAGEGSAIGRGGMITKINAARVAARGGANTIISSGRTQGILSTIATGQVDGTLLTADRELLVARKQWLATLAVKGKLTLDEGACRVLIKEGRSLLPVGVTGVHGDFTRGEMVACLDSTGKEIARGLINYSSSEAGQLCGVSSNQIESVLGYIADEELIHRDNLVLS
jgi:glutamate 5-kinase